jgi:hypothetical protein
MSEETSTSDLRRREREARARPWLTNSVLRRSPVASSSGLAGSNEDAPSLLASATVTADTDRPPTATVLSEGRRTDNTKQETSCLSQAVPTAMGSRIPRWVGFLGVLSRSCPPRGLDRVGVQGKVGSTAISPTVTGGKTPGSRLPVPIKNSVAGCRPASSQVRPSDPLVTNTGGMTDKGVGTGAKVKAVDKIQSCFKPGPIKSHRTGRTPRSILKPRAALSGGTSLPDPPSSVGQGVKPDPGKKVRISEAPPSATPPRHWPMKLIGRWIHKCCGLVECQRCWADRPYTLPGEVWLEEQADRGHDYLKHSGGLWGGKDFSTDLMVKE